MTFFQDLKKVVDEAVNKPVKSNERRDLNEGDRLSWYDAASERESSINPRTIDDVRALVRNENPIRWMQLQGHYRWVQRRMKKLGLNPEDARYLL